MSVGRASRPRRRWSRWLGGALRGAPRRLDRRRRGARRGPRARRSTTSTWPSPATRARRRRRSPGGRWPRLRALGRVRDLARRRPRRRLAGRRRPRCAARRSRPTSAERDFTIGAVAVPLAGGEPIDPFGGLADLERGACCGWWARSSFADDPLRLLRAARLAAELELEVDGDTPRWPAPKRAAGGEPAGERQLAELRRLLGGRRPAARPGCSTSSASPPVSCPSWRRSGGRAGAQPPPRRPRPHSGRARAHARGRGATSSASPASARPTRARCSTSRSPTR